LLVGDTQTGKTSFANLVTRVGYSKFIATQNVTNISNYGKLTRLEKSKGCEIHSTIRNVDFDVKN
jgi:hypothetical protein